MLQHRQERYGIELPAERFKFGGMIKIVGGMETPRLFQGPGVGINPDIALRGKAARQGADAAAEVEHRPGKIRKRGPDAGLP
jgi:hypothetical protein